MNNKMLEDEMRSFALELGYDYHKEKDFYKKYKKIVEYYKYIEEHIRNISIADSLYGITLSKELGVDPRELSYKIAKHDQSKFGDEEFEGYRQWFYPLLGEKKDKEMFDKAWEHHYTINDHHPEHWIDDDGNVAEMPTISLLEMILDWEAMSIKFNSNTYEWYQKNKKNIKLGPNTQKTVERLLETYFKPKVLKD